MTVRRVGGGGGGGGGVEMGRKGIGRKRGGGIRDESR